MFSCSNRYQTRGIINNVDIRLQILMWKLIDELKEKKKVDYLQIFKLSRDTEGRIIIEHSQEVPKYKAVYKINLDIEEIFDICEETTLELDGIRYSGVTIGSF